jgi:lipoprotein-releasing system permease protein
MRYELIVGLRYLRARRGAGFASWGMRIAALGLVVGVATLNVVLAVYTGFEEELRNRILGFHPHLVIVSFTGTVSEPDRLLERVRTEPAVRAAVPFLLAQAMLSNGNAVTGVLVRGIARDAESVVPLSRFLRAGRVEDLWNADQHHLPGILIGKGVAKKLGLQLGDTVQMVSPAAQATAVGFVPRIEPFVVRGIVESGLGEYDAALAFVALEVAQKFFGLEGKTTGVEVRIDDVYRAPQVGAELAEHLGFPYRVRNWIDLNRNLFSALALGKAVYFLVLLLIVLVAAFNVVSTLLMAVMERRKDIAILMSMGATRRSVRRIFVATGMLLGVSGVLAGSIGGWGLGWLIAHYRFVDLPADVYGIDRLEVRLYPEYFLLVAAVTLLLCYLAAIYPARQAARLSPVEVIRYE